MDDDRTSFWRSLLHRWFIQYNPLYLLSSALVLIGVSTMSRELVRSESTFGILGVAAISETYAWALIGGAALLTRIGLRRPAFQLALITALYQCDPTLHTETCAYLGWAGGAAALAWLASFAGKLFALGRALDLRLSRASVAVATFGAVGVILLPRALRTVDASTGTVITALWVFALFASALWSQRAVESVAPLDGWGRTVLRRGTQAVWTLWAGLTLSHVLFWADEFELGSAVLVPVAMLLGTRWLKSELAVWCATWLTLLFVAAKLPAFLSPAAIMAAAVLCLRAFRTPLRAQHVADDRVPAYRVPAFDLPPPEFTALPLTFVRASREAIVRLLASALFATYLSVWTFGWSGGAWPEHQLWLDLPITAMTLLLVFKARARMALVPLAATYFHLAVKIGWIRAPASDLEWGEACAATGFGLLVASLLVAWRVQKRRPDAARSSISQAPS